MAPPREKPVQSEIRRQHLSDVLAVLHLSGPVSRSVLAGRLGVNRSTVASLVRELSARGFVRERRPEGRNTLGRPSPIVEPRPDGPVVLAVDIATDSLSVAVVGLAGKIRGLSRIERRHELCSPHETVQVVGGLARPLLDGLRNGQAVLGVGVSIPGLVRVEDGLVRHAPNLEWRDVPLAAIVRETLRLDRPVFVRNDADLAAYAEHQRGSGVGASEFICLWGEAGIGAGIIVRGQPLAGSAGYAGEVGHMLVNPAGEPCHCGSHGCWETEVGEDALLRQAGRHGGGGRELPELLAAVELGDPAATAAVEDVGHWLGVGIAGLTNIFNPTRVALGGLYARFFPYVRESIEKELDRYAMRAPRQLVSVTAASLGRDSSLIGAAELAFAPFLEDPTKVPVGEPSEGPTRDP